MQNANAYNVYKNNNVNYASREKLLIMLLDGAVNFSKIARQAIVDNDINKAHQNIVKTQNIFYELMNSLDITKGGEWAKQLMSIYEFITARLTQANLKKDLKIMDEMIPLIEDIRNTWDEAYKISKGIK